MKALSDSPAPAIPREGARAEIQERLIIAAENEIAANHQRIGDLVGEIVRLRDLLERETKAKVALDIELMQTKAYLDAASRSSLPGAPSDTLTAGEAAMCLRALHGQPIYLTDTCLETGKVLEAKLKDWMFSND